MGGRGAGSSISKEVPFEKWGANKEHETIYDEEGTAVGSIYDETRYNMVSDIHKMTKKEILGDLEAWKNDDGTYGDDDTRILVWYDDGSYVIAEEIEPGKRLKKSGIAGVSISTGDYESVWGNEYDTRTRQWTPLKTWSEDGESGLSNVYSGYKPDSMYKVRIKRYSEKYYRKDGTIAYRTRYETIKRSTTVKL